MESITAYPRDPAEKVKQLRRGGAVPGVIYGAELRESIPIRLDAKAAARLKRSVRPGSKALVLLDDKRYPTLIKELVYDSLREEVVHISFQLLRAGRKYNSVADIFLLNKDKAPGILEQIQLQVPHAAEPEYLLDAVTVDLTDLPIGTALTIGDIPEFQSDKIELRTDPSNLVFRISEKKRDRA